MRNGRQRGTISRLVQIRRFLRRHRTFQQRQQWIRIIGTAIERLGTGRALRDVSFEFFDRKFDQLWDLSGATEVQIEAEAIKELARARSFEAGAKRAVVAPSDLAFGMARMFQLLHDEAPEDVRVFRAEADARRWLGLED